MLIIKQEPFLKPFIYHYYANKIPNPCIVRIALHF
jgi:hypothetical protein